MFESTTLPRRRYPPELKLKVVLDALSNTSSKAAIGRKYDINANQVANWIRQYRADADWVKKAKSSDMFPSDMLPIVIQDPPKTDKPLPPSRGDLRVRFHRGHELTLSRPTDSQLGLILRTLA